ncbi:MAG TPA: A24 family peptidase [Thermoanaerobaculaceae bacterium]|nr:A24 family peptidase [Thermoanaerobaculaceae bacterium]
MAGSYVPAWFVPAVAAAYGLVFGSFLNVVIHRLPRGMSLVRPRSHCPACGAPVRWFDNIPVVSYVLLLGRCRACRSPISPRYPAVELACGALAAGVAARFGLTVAGAEAMLLVMLLLPLAFIDLEHHLLPDVLTLPGIGLGLACSAAGGLATIADALVGAAVGAGVPYAVMVAYRRLRGVEGMGLGDVKLLAMIGAFLGWRPMLLTLAVGAAGGALVGLTLIAAGKGRRDTELPFGTFLCAAAVVVLFAGPAMMRLLGWARP